MKKITARILPMVIFVMLSLSHKNYAQRPQILETQSYTGHLVRTTPRLSEIDRKTMYGAPLVITRDKDGVIGIGRKIERTEEKIEEQFNNASKHGVTDDIQDPAATFLNTPWTTLGVNFDGQTASVSPTDNNIAVGPNHVIQIINNPSGSQFTIYDKLGNVVGGPTILATLTGFPGYGDPVVLYDQLADRWVLMELGPNTLPIHHLNIAVSVTPDPTGAWNIYQYTDITFFIDYEKMSVWHNGYYLTSNDFGNGGGYLGSSVYSMDRDSMLAGAATATMIRTRMNDGADNNYNMGTIGLEGMTPSTQNGLFVYPVPASTLNIFEVTPDFIAGTQVIGPIIPLSIASFTTPPFSVPQQGGGSCQTLGHRMMFKLNYRNNGGTESIVMTHTVGNSGLAAVRWYELRRVSSAWTVYQQGTITGADGNSRFMGGISMDGCGNIALMYDVSGTTANPSIRYTGRYQSDPLGAMTLPEATIINGASPHTGSNRWGDYNTTVQDYTSAGNPNDGSFWSTSQYGNQLTRIANYTISGGCEPSPGIASGTATLTAEGCVPNNGKIDPNETVTVSFCALNFGNLNTTNLVGTMQASGNVIPISGPQSYGVVSTGGPAVCGSFSFSNSVGFSDSVITVNIHWQDGAFDLGTSTWTFELSSIGFHGSETFAGQVSVADTTTSLRSNRQNLISSCTVPSTCGAAVAGTFQYKNIVWTNPSTTPMCVYVTYTNPTSNLSYVSAFNGPPNLSSLCLNLLGNPGGGSANPSQSKIWSFTAPPGAPINFFITNITTGETADYIIKLDYSFNEAVDTQTVCINTPISDIQYATKGTSGATFSGLPPGVTGNWANDAVTISGTPTASGTFNYTVTLTGSCGNITAKGQINVNPETSITGNTIICSGDSTLLDVGAHVSYLWSTGATTQAIYVAVAGKYIVTVTDANGCMGMDSVLITVNAIPNCSISGSNFCYGGSTQLCTATNASYEWSTGATTQCITATLGGNYTATITDANGCTSTCNKTIIAYTPPTCAITGDFFYCSGSSTQICAPAGLSSYRWNTGATTQCITVTAGDYTVTVTDANGCTGSCDAVVTERPLPIASFTGLAISYQLNAAPASLTGIPTGGTFSGPGISGNTFNPSLAGVGGPYTITYFYSDTNTYCSKSVSKQTSVMNCVTPPKPGTISGATKVCSGDSKTYTIVAVSGALSYTWTAPLGVIITAGQGTTTITVKYTGSFTGGYLSVVSCGCGGVSTAKTLLISKNTAATPSVISGPVNGTCKLSSVTYSVVNVPGTTYQWALSTSYATIVSGQGSNAVIVKFYNSFTLGQITVKTISGCGTSAIRSLTISAAPVKPGTIIGAHSVCKNAQGVPYSISPVTSALNYTWLAPAGAHIKAGSVTSSSNSLVTTYTSVKLNFGSIAGNLQVKATNNCGSGAYSSLYISVGCREEGLSLSNDFNVVCYPIPATNELNVSFLSESVQVCSIRITDVLGKTLLKQINHSTIGENKLTLNVSMLSSGIYMIEVLNGEQKSIQKIMIE